MLVASKDVERRIQQAAQTRTQEMPASVVPISRWKRMGRMGRKGLCGGMRRPLMRFKRARWRNIRYRYTTIYFSHCVRNHHCLPAWRIQQRWDFYLKVVWDGKGGVKQRIGSQ